MGKGWDEDFISWGGNGYFMFLLSLMKGLFCSALGADG